MTPILYKADETEFTNNGLGKITGIIQGSAIVQNTLNGAYTFDFELAKNSRFYNVVKEEMIVKVKPDSVRDYDLFMITDIDKDSTSGYVKVSCSHISVILNNYMAQNQIPIDGFNAQYILNQIKSATNTPSQFSLTTDIDEQFTGTNVIFESNTNVNEMVIGSTNSIAKVTGTYVLKDKFNMNLTKANDFKTIVLRKGKNISNISVKRSLNGLVTAIIPYYKPKEGENKEPIYGSKIKSPLYSKYQHEYLKAVDFSSAVEGGKDFSTEANNYFNDNPGIDKPAYDVEINTFEYRSLRKQKFELADFAKIYDPDFDINVQLRIYEMQFDPINESATVIKAGTQATSVFHNLDKKIDNVSGDVSDVKDDVNETNKNVDDLKASDKEKQQLMDELKKNVNDTRDNMLGYINGSGRYVIRFLPNRENPTDIVASESGGNYGMRWNSKGIYYDGKGTVAIDNRGNVYADKFVGQSMTGIYINGGEIHGVSITGDTGLALSSGSTKTSVTSYGISTPNLTVYEIDGVRGMSTANGGYIWVDGAKLTGTSNGDLLINGRKVLTE
ncbi:phage tail spike protein [Companilactobacillus versmoldensis]|uniref:Minor structural protein n=1 Tax=Companilactobacillus versmoldensis DSM 14857 = KCTC 3814 TaxID=1423815 RepID=A0A0R1SFC5_9LACO|nr:phage tail spike protein [Companilactobacillus versmoldensis]KRL68093.1 minor structural protein [Companilactobacillus versmoldensis DSM 14857 = KCTC 3814]